MSVSCSICTGAFLQTTDTCATSCGHLFHYPCLLQWLEHQKSCPQCRKDTTEETIIKIYPTIEDNDVGALRETNDNLLLQLNSKSLELKCKEEDIQKLHLHFDSQTKVLMDKQSNMETQLRTLKEIVRFYKKRNEKKCTEILKLKQQVDDLIGFNLKSTETADCDYCYKNKAIRSRLVFMLREVRRLNKEGARVRELAKKTKHSEHKLIQRSDSTNKVENNVVPNELAENSDSEYDRIIYSHTVTEQNAPMTCIILDD